MEIFSVPAIAAEDFFGNYYQKEAPAFITQLFLEASAAFDHLSKWQRVSGKGLSPRDRFYRMLYLYRQAFDAEGEMKTVQADFFFERSYRLLSRLYDDNKQWEGLEIELHQDPNLKHTLIKDLFLPGHIAFANGYMEKQDDVKIRNRAIVHLGFCTKLTNLLFNTELGPEEEMYRKKLAWFKMNAYEKLGRGQELITESEPVIKNCAGTRPFLIRLIKTVFSDAISAIKADRYQENAHVLESAINKLEACGPAAREIDIYYYRLGELYYYFAIAQANLQKLSKALLYVRKGIAYNPYTEGIEKSWNSLAEQMQQMQERIKNLLLELRQKPNTYLNEAGVRMKAETDVGFTTVNHFIEKEEEDIIAKRQLSYIYEIFDEELNDTTLTGDRISGAKELDQLIGELSTPGDQASLSARAKWENLKQEFTDVQLRCKEKVIEYVDHYNNRPDFDAMAAGTLEDESFKSLHIAPRREAFNMEEEPFIYWLAGPKDIFTKIVIAASFILLLTAATLYGQKFYNDHKRNAAYLALTESLNQKDDHKAILNHASVFLDHLPLMGSDSRTPAVISIYKEELTKWFMDDDQIDQQQFSSYLKKIKNTSIEP